MTSLSTLARPRVLAVAMALGLAATVLPAQPADAAMRVKGRMFGMTDFDPSTFPQAPVGSVRLWDSGVSWREIETSPGVFDFSRLDVAVSTARNRGADVLIVLGQTPKFHAVRPGAASLYGPGASSAPRITPWKRYVRKVAERYRGRGVDYQVWNEANVSGFWSGSHAKMAELTKVTSKVLASADPKASLVAPAMATRLSGQRAWLRTFYSQRTGGARVGRWVDIVSLNLYPLSQDGPETSMTLLSASRTMLRSLGVTKPIWNTEINYGLQTGGGGVARDISRKREASLVARTYTLNAANGVKRVFWYAWDLQKLANTQLTEPDGDLTKAGRTYSVVQGWLKGTNARGCSRSARGTYTCTFSYKDGVKRVYWNPSRRATIRTVPSATRLEFMTGGTDRVGGGKSLSVNF
ncbi:MAG TPA: glycosyl hydrolase, partial [Actinomycetes bacterium]